MSGHSKWTQIKRQKGATDQKRGILFTKLGKTIAIAAREGGSDPATNFKLRLAIDQAKSFNMPNDNIDRAIVRGTGKLEGQPLLEEAIYEGYGPGGVAIIVFATTDNKNRTSANIKHIFSKFGGALGSPNSVIWMFDKRGIIQIQKTKILNRDALELTAIDAGSEDISDEDDILVIATPPDALERVASAISPLCSSEGTRDIAYIAKNTVSGDAHIRQTIEQMLDMFNEDDDVNDYYTNMV